MTNTNPAATVAFVQYLHENPATRALAVGLCQLFALRRETALIPVDVDPTQRRAAS